MTNKTDAFYRCGEQLKAQPYEYEECGLPNIFLHNGYDVRERDGDRYVSIIDMEGLHRTIGEHIIATRKELAPAEVRFLRKTMDITQAELARRIGQSSQQVARWEKGTSAIPGPADRLVRAIFLLEMMDAEELASFVRELPSMEDMDERPAQPVVFRHNDDAWSDRMAA